MMQPENSTPQPSNVFPFPAPRPAPAPAASGRAPRERLKAAHRRTACRLGVIFDDTGVSRLIPIGRKTTIRRNVTRLANLVGVPGASIATDATVPDIYTRAMFEVYARAARGEDVRKALRAAASVRRWTSLYGTPPAPAAAPSFEEKAARSRRELLDACRLAGAHADETFSKLYPLGAVRASCDALARYGIRKDDRLRFTLDGDAEQGELAIVTFYAENRRRFCVAVFLFVEGEHFCLRYSPLECKDLHHRPERLTVIGRVVRAERGGLPVRLKGLELRGLPFAEDTPESEEKREGAA